MRKLTVLLFLTTISLITVKADSIPENKGINKFRPYFQLDSYHSFIGKKSADVIGFKIGVEMNREWRLAIGYNRIKSDVVRFIPLSKEEAIALQKDSTRAQLCLDYFPILLEYIFYKKNDWQLSTPFIVGYGNTFYRYYSSDNEKRKTLNRGVLFNEIGIGIQYKINQWVGIGTVIGYRYALIKNNAIDAQLNSPTFSLKLKLFPEAIYHSIKHEFEQ